MTMFSINTKVYWGPDATKQAIGAVRELGVARVLFIVDNAIIDTPGVQQLLEHWREGKFDIEIAPTDCAKEPSYPWLDEFTDSVRGCRADLIVAVGGGSAMDLAKGVGVLLGNPGKGLDYRGMHRVEKPGVPVVCYPSTAGTGSEVTHTASFIDPESMTKLGINGRYVAPLFGVLMPELVFSCPPSVALSSGLDAMVHALEAISANNANGITAMIGVEAFRRLYENLPLALACRENYQAQEAMLLGSYLAGMAMMNAGGGPASGISYPLGVHYQVPHGFAGGIFLPGSIDMYVEKGYRGFARCYRWLPDADPTLDDAAASKAFADCFNRFYAEVGAPKTLSRWGVKRAHVEELVRITVEQRQGNLDLCPVHCDGEDVRKLLEAVTED